MKSSDSVRLKRLTVSGLMLALALVLPFLTGQIRLVGKMLAPLHFPVLLCGFLCGWPWGLAVGLIAPVLRSALFGMPLMYPTAVCMALELAAYGFVTGWLYRLLPRRIPYLYVSLLAAMMAGRLVYGAARFALRLTAAVPFTLRDFFAASFLEAWPGMLVQLILIPLIVLALRRAHLTGNDG